MKKINSSRSIILYFLIFLFFSCSEKKSDTIRIGILQGPSAISFARMRETVTELDGKKVEYIEKSEPLQIQALMMQNKLDFAVLPTVMAVNLYNKGVNFKMIACPVWGTLYIISSNPGITDMNSLNCKTIGVFGQGATADILLQHELKTKSITGVNINYSYTTNHDLAMALMQGKIETAVISEPLVSNLLMKNNKLHIVSKLNCEEIVFNTDKEVFVQSAFLVNNRLTNEYKHLISKVSAAYAASCKYINEQPDEAAKLIVKYHFCPDTVVAQQAIKLCNIRYVAAFTIEPEINEYLKIFLRYEPKSIGGSLPQRDFIYKSIE